MLRIITRSLTHNIKHLCVKNPNCGQETTRFLSSLLSNKTQQMGKETWIVWMDLEMTGLDVRRDKILEICCLITDKELNIVAEGPVLEIHQTDEVLNNMNEWCMKHHNESKLVDRCRSSTISVEMAEDLILKFLETQIPRGKCPLAGNSVYMDRLFIDQYMPKVNNYLHYRIIDVSTVKELCRRWNPNVAAGAPKKRLVHRSLDDIKESIEEMRYYKKFFFK